MKIHLADLFNDAQRVGSYAIVWYLCIFVWYYILCDFEYFDCIDEIVFSVLLLDDIKSCDFLK